VEQRAGGAVARVPRVTVVFLLYNAARDVEALVACLARQRHPSGAPQEQWLEAVFYDDASRDGTPDVLRQALSAVGERSHYRAVLHPSNVGLAGTLNEAFSAASTPFLLTCHLDCRFGSDTYVAEMLELIESHPEAAAITGQPELPPGARPPFAEKLNVVANLMDVFPEPGAAELEPVGFAEGRCDVFRVEALRAVGLYDTRLRVSGEDQVLAARLRARGHAIYKASRLVYHLSVSGEQDSVRKLLHHQRLFGRTTPYIVLAVPGSSRGLVGSRSGANRTRRALLRAVQLAGTGALLLLAVSLLVGWPLWLAAAAIALVLTARFGLQARHARRAGFGAGDWLRFVALAPVFDLAFSVGIVEGLGALALSRGKPID
jgi:glycosyltransferase involved in cell wall biosynthesis